MLTREQKVERTAELKAALDGVTTLFVLENTGLRVNEINELRSKIRAIDGASYKVFKNSLVRLAIAESPLEPISDILVGPNAFAFTTGDSVELAKTLRDFVKDHPKLNFKSVYLDGAILDASGAEQLAEMPSKHELLTKLAYVLQSPIRRLAVACNEPISKLARVVDQIAKKKEEAA